MRPGHTCPILAIPHAQGLKDLFLQLVLKARVPKLSEFTPGAQWAAPHICVGTQAWGTCVLKAGVVTQGLAHLQPQG